MSLNEDKEYKEELKSPRTEINQQKILTEELLKQHIKLQEEIKDIKKSFIKYSKENPRCKNCYKNITSCTYNECYCYSS
jgi:hypothetical protein